MAVGVTSLILIPYIREQTISVTATVKNGEAVFTLTSPHSSAPVTDRGTPAAIGSAGLSFGPGHVRATRSGLLKATYLYVPVPSRAILSMYIIGRRSLSG